MTEENGFSIPPPLVVSLDLELATLSGATLGAQLLADLQSRKELERDMERDAPVGVFSILALVRERINQLRRVVRNEENPAHIWAPHNAVEDPATTGEFPGDIVLFSWESMRLPLVMWGVRAEGSAPRRGTEESKPEESKSEEPKPEEAPPRVN